ncbi:MAG: phage virion morphogenesis protein [Alcanivorax sp.]
MAGARIELDSSQTRAAISRMIGELQNPVPLYQQIIEYLRRVHRDRFRTQHSPAGQPWAALSPAWQKRKHRNKDKILTFRGYLRDTLVGQYDADGVEFGTSRVYGAIHQFGGWIPHPRAGKIYIPARPWLGTDEDQDLHMVRMARTRLEKAARG